MTKVLLFVLGLSFCPGQVFGQAGSIGVFADPGGTDCNLSDIAPGLIKYYFVHVQTSGSTACVFSAPPPQCLQATYINTDCGPYHMLSCDARTEIIQGYGTCLAGPIHVASVNFFGSGLTGLCCYYPVKPSVYEPSGQIVVVDCDGNLMYATGGTGIVNPTSECTCDVPAKTSTWGKTRPSTPSDVEGTPPRVERFCEPFP